MVPKKHKIVSVEAESPASKAGIHAGDLLLTINGATVIDVFDYRTRIAVNTLALGIEKSDSSYYDVIISKDEYEDLGLEFETPLMDSEKVCKNKCIFCFVDQLPANLRKSLYFKDDDLRLSFLSGNYVTLTNIGDEELDRLISYKLSPMNISVHTTNPKLRVQMLGNPRAGHIMDQLRKISDAGITINTQLVLCPGINDGEELERSLTDLEGLSDNLQSIALVPVGLTGHREDRKLEPLKPYESDQAAAVIRTVNAHQRRNLRNSERRIVFASDEFYVRAGTPIPQAKEYEEFYQLDNGVGLLALFINEMRKGINKRLRRLNQSVTGPADIAILITGLDAAPYISAYTSDLEKLYGMHFEVKAINNTFFGDTVTVAGLVTGGDIIRSANCEDKKVCFLLPEVMLRHSRDKFLDDMSTDEFRANINGRVYFVPSSAAGFLSALDEIITEQ